MSSILTKVTICRCSSIRTSDVESGNVSSSLAGGTINELIDKGSSVFTREIRFYKFIILLDCHSTDS